jgi:scyllo-inositol 2-dehydrogenase (NADP+)
LPKNIQVQNTINAAIIGFGISGRVFHAPFLITNPRYNWTTVLERTTNHAAAIYPAIKTVRSIEQILNDASVDLVIITTPNETHFPLAKQAMLAGKHVVVEKPFTNNTNDAKELIALAEQQKVILSVYHNRRYVSDFKTFREILNKNLLGEPVIFEGYYDRYRPEKKINAWREENKPGSGILFDLGSHLIDQALVLFGQPKKITAVIRIQRKDVKADDYFDLHLDYGLLQVRLRGGMLVREMGPRYMIHGTKGSFIKSGNDTQEDHLKNGGMPGDKNFGEEPEEIWGLIHTEIDNKVIREKYPSHKGNYGGYYDDLYETIANGAPLQVTPQQAHNNIRVLELAIESNRKGCAVECNGFVSRNRD